jgi:uncharacterized protein YwbE
VLAEQFIKEGYQKGVALAEQKKTGRQTRGS